MRSAIGHLVPNMRVTEIQLIKGRGVFWANILASPLFHPAVPPTSEEMAPKKSSGGKKKDEGDGEADRVHVVVRIRPPQRKDEREGAQSESLQYDAEKNMLFLLTTDEEGKPKPKQYQFDRVLWKDSVQQDAWLAAGESVVNSVLQGYTGCVMCYGQTGAGKTFTLANEKEGQEGVMIQAFNHIFRTADQERELKYEIEVAFQQIYLDGISDLLDPRTVCMCACMRVHACVVCTHLCACMHVHACV